MLSSSLGALSNSRKKAAVRLHVRIPVKRQVCSRRTARIAPALANHRSKRNNRRLRASAHGINCTAPVSISWRRQRISCSHASSASSIDIRVETPSTFPAPWHTRMILRASALLSLRLCAHPRCQPARHSPTHPTNNPFAHRPLPLPSTPAPARAAYPVHVMATDRQIQANRLATPEGEQISSKHAALHRLTSGAIVSSMRQSNEFAVSRRSPDENFQYEPNLSAELEDDHVLQ
jgi:hypothetical protein